MNDKIQHFGVVITPLSRKNISFKAILVRRINIQGCEDIYENTFARMVAL